MRTTDAAMHTKAHKTDIVISSEKPFERRFIHKVLLTLQWQHEIPLSLWLKYFLKALFTFDVDSVALSWEYKNLPYLEVKF